MKLLAQVWSYIRAVSGDAAYDTYARHLAKTGAPPQSREAFYLESLQRRYSNPNRCC